ncbi:MAG TPA: hypothetical protein VGZ90_13355 [Puia sp.]|jgi:hypothetical protein|nr:hypothetical protein [Puia sp.]
MQYEKKYMGRVALDADSDVFALGENSIVNSENFRTLSTDTGVVETLESVGGTLLIPNSDLSATGVNWCIGGGTDWSNRRQIFAIWNSLGNHGIFCFDYIADKIFTVLLNADVIGGLNFDKYHFIHSMRIENGCAYWTDNFNEPRRVDINAGINLHQPNTFPGYLPYQSPMNPWVIAWIRRQPGQDPTSIRLTDTTYINNFIKYEAFKFSYRYQYRNFELSTLSGLSALSNYNRELIDTYNRIDVSLPVGEKIDQDIIQIDLVAYYVNSNTYFIIKSWTTSTDAAAIAAHNAGTTPLTFQFFNDFTGIAIDPLYAVKPFDSLPIYCQTIEIARLRGFMANYTIGYTAPTTTSLGLAPRQGGNGSQVIGKWFFFKWKSICGGFPSETSFYIIDISDIPQSSNPGYYIYVPGGYPPFAPSIDWSYFAFRGASLFDIMNYYGSGCTNYIEEFTYQNATSIILNPPSAPFLIGQRAMKSDASYAATITFFDYAGRKAGIVNSPVKVYIPDRIYGQVQWVTGIDWVLSNLNALVEIPPWAASYSINITQCLRTRFFLQMHGKAAAYATKDASGNYVFTTNSFAPNLNGCAFDITLLDSYQMGYVWQPGSGDVIKIYFITGTSASLQIIGQVGNWLITELRPLGTFDAFTKFLFEIYTPYKATATEPYFEVGQQFPIINPGTVNRQYSVTAGTIKGDITLLDRNDGIDYLTEAMSPNDKLYKNWNTDIGRPNFIDPIGQVVRQNSIAYSNTFIQGSHINGLSTFDPLDVKDISADYGPINKLQLASKVQKTGSIMLAICGGGETASLYLGERTLMDTAGGNTLMQSIDVIGTVNTLKGERGTLNPESVFEHRGNVYWFDVQNGKWVQYADNGLFDVSNYKMNRFWKLFADQYKSMTPQQIEAFGNRPFVVSCVDPHHGELLCSIPKTLADPPKGYLPDYPSMPYPFDIFDGLGKTLIYKLFAEPNKWQGAIRMTPDFMFYIEDNLFAFNQGQLYRCNNTATPANFFGVQYKARVMTASNHMPNKPKVYKNVAIEGNMTPSLSYYYTKYPWLMATDLLSWNYSLREGIPYSTLFRNKLDPKWWPDMQTSLLRGEEMRTVALLALYEFDVSQGPCELKFVNFGFSISLGHTV